MGATYVGTSKRYADSIDAKMGAQADLSVMRSGEPESLTARELELKTEPVTRTPRPMNVTAWVRYGKVGIHVRGRAVAWTAKAVAVEWDAPQGTHRAWVWASAVDRDDRL
jgi:hypothetical protein